MKLAALQMRAVPGDVEANLTRIASAARDAARQGASILVAPELVITGYGARDAICEEAQTIDGERIAQLAGIAKSSGIAILAGFAERDGPLLRNSAVYVDGESRPVVYRKSNLYGPYEHDLFAQAGPETVIVERGGLRFGILICYDVEFPENVRRLAVAGVDAVLVPTALPADDEAAFIARKLVPVRAFENRVHVLYADHCGGDDRFSYAGLSVIAAPDGALLAQANATDEALLVAECVPGRYAALTKQTQSLAGI